MKRQSNGNIYIPFVNLVHHRSSLLHSTQHEGQNDVFVFDSLHFVFILYTFIPILFFSNLMNCHFPPHIMHGSNDRLFFVNCFNNVHVYVSILGQNKRKMILKTKKIIQISIFCQMCHLSFQ